MIDVITALEDLGYMLTVDAEALRVRYTGDGSPPKDTARSLFAALSRRKGEAIDILNARSSSALSKEAATPATVQRSDEGATEDRCSTVANADCNGQEHHDPPKTVLERPKEARPGAIRALNEPTAASDSLVQGELTAETVAVAECNGPATVGSEDRCTVAPLHGTSGTRGGEIVGSCSRCGQPSRIHCAYHGRSGVWLAWCDTERCARSDVVDEAAMRRMEAAS